MSIKSNNEMKNVNQTVLFPNEKFNRKYATAPCCKKQKVGEEDFKSFCNSNFYEGWVEEMQDISPDTVIFERKRFFEVYS